MLRIQISPAAEQDILGYHDYLADEAGDTLAKRLLTCLKDSFDDLSKHPTMGAPLGVWAAERNRLQLPGWRSILVSLPAPIHWV